MSDPSQTDEVVHLSKDDIVFTCPFCVKSLAIEDSAQGMEITCPDCGERVIVPALHQREEPAQATSIQHLTDEEQIDSLSKGLKAAHNDIRRLSAELAEVSRRRLYLEKLRADHMHRLERVAEELRVVKSSIDRIVSLVQDSTAEAGNNL